MKPTDPPTLPTGKTTGRKSPVATLSLNFKPHKVLEHVGDPLAQDISALAIIGRTLFTACDETATVERLVRTADGNYHQKDNIVLGRFFDLPDGRDGEMDIEGLAVDDGYLWIAGSHALKRGKPKPADDDGDEYLEELADIECDPNRYFLGRVPLKLQRGGIHGADHSESRNTSKSGAASLKMKSKGGNRLTGLLYDDRHLRPSITMPCKENGFDIEGIAVRGDCIFLGLRGPVLRGWAIIIELRVKQKKRGRLKLRKCGSGGRRYLKHFLPLEGLGIRDLRFDGDDLLVLAGPTMDHDGTGALYRWHSPLGSDRDRMHAPDAVEHIMDFPYERGADQAEGICFTDTDDEQCLIAVHDSPTSARLRGDGLTLIADLYRLD